jgi:cystathionine beta-lyase/cystathionine gamma-synthase
MTGDAETSQPPPAHPATRAITAGRAASGTSLAPVLWSTTTWESEGLADAHRRATGTRAGEFYSRYANPTVRSFEEAVASLEGAEDALAFASGMGAVSSVVLALCSAGDHVVAQRQCYAGTIAFLQGPCQRLGIETTFVDAREPGAFAAAIRPGKTMLVLAETPANPRLDLVDLDELGAISGPFTVVDSTLATPLAQQPLAHGVDLVLHSATKGIAGHNDATLGVVAGEAELIEAIWAYAVLHGATPSPYDALNALRGIRTLSVRTTHQAESALHLADAVADHPAVAALECAEDALAFASGMGAVSSVILALCSAGDHVVAQRQLYAGTLAPGKIQTFRSSSVWFRLNAPANVLVSVNGRRVALPGHGAPRVFVARPGGRLQLAAR